MTRIYAVIDTNVIVAALLSKKDDTAVVRVMRAVLGGELIPLVHKEIIAEYYEVLRREKFHLKEEIIDAMLNSIIAGGVEAFPKPSGEILIDMDDLIFYEVALDRQENDAYLVTGNQKHYPIRDFIVTPAEMMRILENLRNHSPKGQDTDK